MTGLMSIYKSRFTPQGKKLVMHYFRQFDNWFEWISAVGILCLFFIPPKEDSYWPKVLAPVVTVVSWANFMHLVGQLSWFGVYVEMYIAVLKTFVELFSVFSILLIGYALSFYMFFKEEGNFSDPLKAMWKTLAMMIGDLEYNDMFDKENASSFSTVHFVYVTFLITTTIVLMNLLVGIVVHDVNEIKNSALETKLIRTINVVLYLDTSSRSLKKIFCLKEGSNLLCTDSSTLRSKLELNENDEIYQDAFAIAIENRDESDDFVDGADFAQLCERAEMLQENISEFLKIFNRQRPTSNMSVT